MSALHYDVRYALTDDVALVHSARLEWLGYDYTNHGLDGNTRDDGTPCGFGGCLYTRPPIATTLTPTPRSASAWTGRSTPHSPFMRSRGKASARRKRRSSIVCRADRTSPISIANRSTSFEIGGRGALSTFDYSTAIYAERSTHVILRDANGFNVSNGKLESAGIEWDIGWTPFTGNRLSMVGTYARHTYAFDRSVTGGEVIKDGHDVDTAPRWLGSAHWLYQPTSNIESEVEMVYQGKYYVDAASTGELRRLHVVELARIVAGQSALAAVRTRDEHPRYTLRRPRRLCVWKLSVLSGYATAGLPRIRSEPGRGEMKWLKRIAIGLASGRRGARRGGVALVAAGQHPLQGDVGECSAAFLSGSHGRRGNDQVAPQRAGRFRHQLVCARHSRGADAAHDRARRPAGRFAGQGSRVLARARAEWRRRIGRPTCAARRARWSERSRSLERLPLCRRARPGRARSVRRCGRQNRRQIRSRHRRICRAAAITGRRRSASVRTGSCIWPSARRATCVSKRTIAAPQCCATRPTENSSTFMQRACATARASTGAPMEPCMPPTTAATCSATISRRASSIRSARAVSTAGRLPTAIVCPIPISVPDARR